MLRKKLIYNQSKAAWHVHFLIRSFRFACPDLTSKEGYWAKALPERYSVAGSILNFYVNNEGELYYGINGVYKGQFLNGINVNSPLWVIVDIYGNSASLEFIGQLSTYGLLITCALH